MGGGAVRDSVPSTEYRVPGTEGGVPSSASDPRPSALFPKPRSLVGWILVPLTWLFIALIRLYQTFISPGLPRSCRFAPSCSQYTLEAMQRHGALKGLWLGTLRLARCHPWHPGGFDPVP